MSTLSVPQSMADGGPITEMMRGIYWLFDRAAKRGYVVSAKRGSAGQVRAARNSWGLTDEDRQRIVALRESGLTQADVAAQVGVSVTTVQRVLGARVSHASLAERQELLRRVQGMVAVGMTHREIGAQIKRSRSYVSLLLRTDGVFGKQEAAS